MVGSVKIIEDMRMVRVLLVLVPLVLGSVFCSSSTDNDDKSTDINQSQTVSTPISTPSVKKLLPSPTVFYTLDFSEIENMNDTLTGDEWEEFRDHIIGTRIQWVAKVNGGNTDTLFLDMDQEKINSIYLYYDSAKDVPRGKSIIFEASIKKLTQSPSYALWLEDTIIVKVLGSTPTLNPYPTSTQIPTETLTGTPTSTATPLSSLVLGSNTYPRLGPGMNFQAVELINSGETLGVYGKSEDDAWLLVDPANQIWVQSVVATLDLPIEDIPILPTVTPTLSPTASPTSTPNPTSTMTPTFTPRPTNTPIPSNTPWPSRTPVPAVRLEIIYKNFEDMTALQFKEYRDQLPGKPIRERVKVGNVSEDGKLIIHGPWTPSLFNFTDFCVVVNRVPKDFALSISGGDNIYLEAKISGIIGDYNFYFNCENTVLLNFECGEK